jgi:sortase A
MSDDSTRKRDRKKTVKRQRYAAVFVVAAIVLVVAGIVLARGLGGDTASGRTVDLKGLKESARKHTDVLSASVRRNLIMKPALEMFNSIVEGQLIGTFEVPQLGIKDHIVEGTEPADLSKGGGHIISTAVPGLGGNFAIAADRVLYSAPLMRAEQLAVGDAIFINMPYGRFDYRVESITVVTPDDISVIQPKGYDAVTFATCDPMWQIDTRIIVHAKIVSSEPKV